MHVRFLEYLVDPLTNETLTSEFPPDNDGFINAGHLMSPSNKYPVVDGIPRFVEYKSDNYSRSFVYQWRKWPRVQFDAENIGKAMENYTKDMWARITGDNKDRLDLQDKVVVDVGCGSGRFIAVVRERGATVIGIDNSLAIDVAAENFNRDKRVCLCQADAAKLPIRDSSADGVFTIGVLHHTPDPSMGVQQANRITQQGGWFSICVYPKKGYYDFTTVQLWRNAFKFLWPVFRHYPPLIYTYATIYLLRPIALLVPVLGRAIRVIFPFINLPDLQWSLLNTFDSITPTYQSAYDSAEVHAWLESEGFSAIEQTDWGKTSFKASK